VEGQEKLLALKIDGLWKHAGCRRAHYQSAREEREALLCTSWRDDCRVICSRGCQGKEAEAGPVPASVLDP
jgi:hypothetical protein